MIAVPVLIGAGMSYLRRPWWWGAIAAVCIFLVAALAPPPEEGESRVALGHLGFLVIVAAIVALLVWIGSWVDRSHSAGSPLGRTSSARPPRARAPQVARESGSVTGLAARAWPDSP